MKVSKTSNNIIYKTFVQIVFIFLTITVLFTLYYLISNSLKTPKEFNFSQFSIPKTIFFSNFKYVWTIGGISKPFLNSIYISSISVVVCLIIAILAGFSFTLYKFRGKTLLSHLIISTMYVSPMAIIIPLFLQMEKLNLNNTYTGIIIIYVGLNLAFSIFLMSTYFQNIEQEIIEAAVIDGCNNISLLIKIFVPLTKPGIIVLSIIVFTSIWNELLFAFIFLQSNAKQTIMVSIAKFQGQYGVGDMTKILSALLITTLPTMIIYLSAQKFLKGGVMLGAIK